MLVSEVVRMAMRTLFITHLDSGSHLGSPGPPWPPAGEGEVGLPDLGWDSHGGLETES